MYSIFTISNHAYAPFLDILLNSTYRNSNVNKINNFYILDLGLSNEYKEYFSSNFNVTIIPNNQNFGFEGVHSDEWCSSVNLKTIALHQLLQSMASKETIILIDNDTFVKRDLSLLIDKDFDIQLTNMLFPHKRKYDDIYLKSIASLCIFNSISSIKFVEVWINIIKELNTKLNPPYETPALNMTIGAMKDYFKLKFMDEILVCADRIIIPETHVVHFKSNGRSKKNAVENFESRISNLLTFVDPINFLEYLNYDLYLDWKKTFD